MTKGRRRADVRPRYGRVGALLLSVLVTAFAMVAGVAGLGMTDGAARLDQARTTSSVGAQQAGSAGSPSASPTSPASPTPTSASPAATAAAKQVAVPANSGTGRRVVFDMSAQRVWLVRSGGGVRATYLVSGSVTDNLRPGRYRVYSRSENAVGVNDSGTMKYFVRFTRGQNAAIGFHDIPIADGQRVQRFDQLGTPQSHGCVRQKRVDAIKLWNFAPVGTQVDVVA